MPNNGFAEAMLELGAHSTFDPTKLSASTLKSVASHIRTLRRNNVPINEESLAHNTIDVLDSLVDKHGEKLSTLYKRQIGMTIKRMYPNIKINLMPYNKKHVKTPRINSEEFVVEIKSMVERASEIIKQAYSNASIDDLGMYDACLSILITSSTSLRINEILQLKMSHIPLITSNEPVSIKSKGNKNVRVIAPNELLLSVFNAIEMQRPKVKANLIYKKTDYASKHQMERFQGNFIIISSEDYMRKKLHELSATISIQKRILGFNVFRKFITTVLIDGGGHLIAQSLNNHSTVNTTLDHYNVVGPQSVQKTYDNLSVLLNNAAVVKVPESVETTKQRLIDQVKSEQQQQSRPLHFVNNAGDRIEDSLMYDEPKGDRFIHQYDVVKPPSILDDDSGFNSSSNVIIPKRDHSKHRFNPYGDGGEKKFISRKN